MTEHPGINDINDINDINAGDFEEQVTCGGRRRPGKRSTTRRQHGLSQDCPCRFLIFSASFSMAASLPIVSNTNTPRK